MKTPPQFEIDTAFAQRLANAFNGALDDPVLLSDFPIKEQHAQAVDRLCEVLKEQKDWAARARTVDQFCASIMAAVPSGPETAESVSASIALGHLSRHLVTMAVQRVDDGAPVLVEAQALCYRILLDPELVGRARAWEETYRDEPIGTLIDHHPGIYDVVIATVRYDLAMAAQHDLAIRERSKAIIH